MNPRPETEGPAAVAELLKRDLRKRERVYERTRAEALDQWGKEGGNREKQRWLLHWLDVEAQIPLATREKILKTAMLLRRKVDRGKLQEGRAREYHHLLLRLGVSSQGNLDDAVLVGGILMRDFNTSPRYLATVLTAYYYYRKANGLPDAEDDLDLKIDRRRHLPTLPPETTLQASIATARRPWWQAYFRLLYEAGPRPTEPLLLQKQDVNFDRQLIRLGTEKGSGETLQRELPISQLLTGQLRVLTASKTATDPIFTKPYVKPLKAIEYEDARTVMVAIRKQLQATGYNVNGLVLYAFRHAFATRLFYATGQKLELVSRAMGHRDPETTRLYLHLQPDQPQRFDVVRLELTNKEAIGKHLGEGWELAVQTPMELWFKRPKWVP